MIKYCGKCYKGWIVTDDNHISQAKKCSCLIRHEQIEYLGPKLSSIYGSGFNPLKSPLLEMDGARLAGKRGNMIISGDWKEVKNHIASSLLFGVKEGKCHFDTFQIVPLESIAQIISDDKKYNDLLAFEGILISGVPSDPTKRSQELMQSILRQVCAARTGKDQTTWILTSKKWGEDHKLWSSDLEEVIDGYRFIEIRRGENV